MIGLRHILISLWCISLKAITPQNVVNRVFTRHGVTNMISICDILIDYSERKINHCYGSDEKMFELMRNQLSDGKQSILNKSVEENHNRIFFGWTPLHDPSIDPLIVPIRNDNEGIDNFRDIPIYFLFVRVDSFKKSIIVEEIVYNPSIQFELDPAIMIYHLKSLANYANSTLDIDPLKKYDNGRWFLILNDIYNIPFGTDTS
jgi:hypothetical protein